MRTSTALVLLLCALAAAAGLAMLQRARPTPTDNSAPELASETPEEDEPAATMLEPVLSLVDQINPVPPVAYDEDTFMDVNVSAFLDMIKVSEGTARAADPYRVCYAYRHTVEDLDYHPAQWRTDESGSKWREWAGEPLDKLGPQYRGMVSTAAGAFQIIKPTWLDCQRALELPDFSPAAQDAAAVYIIDARCHALDDVRAGNIAAAIAKCSTQWASLPGANAAGQPMRPLDQLLAAFEAAGGTLA